MTLDVREVGRLAILQKEPLRWVERRVETLDLVDDYHYGVTVTQQLVAPRHADPKEPTERELLIPLGQFSKDRMPDFRVEDESGAELPLLSRDDRATLAAQLFSADWGHQFLGKIPEEDRAWGDRAWNAVLKLVARAVAGSKRKAELALDALELTLGSLHRTNMVPGSELEVPQSVRDSALALLCNEDAWLALNALAETRLLVARLRGVPGQRYVVTVRYTERFAYHGYARPRWFHVLRHGRRLLAWLGLIAVPIARTAANGGQAASVWIVQSVPEGVEALRYYWKSDRHNEKPAEPVSVEVNRTVASSHAQPNTEPDHRLTLEAQIEPSTALLALIGLAGLLFIVATYVYQAIPAINPSQSHTESILANAASFQPAVTGPSEQDRALLVGLGSVFAAVPAAIAGALAYRGQAFTRRMSHGPRTLVALLSLLAAFFAIVVSLKDLDELAEGTAFIVSIYCLWLLGVAAFIQWGPRWRKGERSRRQKRTEGASPISCRRNQIWSAVFFLITWTAVVIVFAHCQDALQEKHFFTSAFPGNIWDALRSWS